MGTVRLTASGLARVEQCPASASLPHVGHLHADAAAGTEAHARFEAECPADEEAEVPLALNVLRGGAVPLERGDHRAYPVLPGDGWIYGTTDRLKVEPGKVTIRDYKSGHGYMVERASGNVQLQFYAVAAALAYGKDAATVEVVTEGRKPDVAEMGLIELDLALKRIKRIWQRATAPSPEVVEGPLCWRCPAYARCPAKVTLALALAGGLEGRELPTLELTHDAVAKGWVRLKQIKAVLGAVEAAYRGYAAETPVPLGGGRTLGAVEKERETVDGRVALAVLTDLIGPDLALGAVDLEASKASVQRAMKTADASRGLSGRVANALDAIRAEGGVGVKRSSNVEEYAE